jgi:diacylglycerol kinase family enzyme
VLINRSGGTAAAMGDTLASAVEGAFAETGREIALELLDGCEIAEAAKRHAGAPLVIIGGGDGTIGAAASVLVHTSSALAVLPLGTRNHFARQLGLPLDLAEAARLALSGQRRRIDIGAAGDRIFINNASFGIYTRFVRMRDHSRGPKWLGTIPATWHALRHMRAQRFSLRIDGDERELLTPLLFIGNNEYSIALGSLGHREKLDDGRLSVCAISARLPLQLLAFAARALVGLARPERDFEEFANASRIVIDGEGHIEGAFDGDLALLPLPLQLRSMPAALGVVTPRETASAQETLLPSESRTL